MIILLRINKSFHGPFTDAPEPSDGESVVEITEGDYSALMALNGKPVVYDNGFREATIDEQIAAADTLAKKLRILLSVLPTVSRVLVLPLAASIQWANDNEHADSVPALLEAFDPKGDAALISAKAKVLSLLQ